MANTKEMISNIALAKTGGKLITTFGESTTSGDAIDVIYDTARDEVLGEHAWSFAQKRVALVEITKPSVTAWLTDTVYAVDDVVEYDSLKYKCLIAHTSDVFSVDLAAVDWVLVTDWVTATTYKLGVQVYYAGISYTCVALHTSGVWATDLAVPDWVASVALNMTDDDITVIYRKPTDWLATNAMSDTDAILRPEAVGFVSDTGSLKIVYTYQCDDPLLYHAKFIMALATKIAYELCFIFTESRPRAGDLLTEYVKLALPKAKAFDAKQTNPDYIADNNWITVR